MTLTSGCGKKHGGGAVSVCLVSVMVKLESTTHSSARGTLGRENRVRTPVPETHTNIYVCINRRQGSVLAYTHSSSSPTRPERDHSVHIVHENVIAVELDVHAHVLQSADDFSHLRIDARLCDGKLEIGNVRVDNVVFDAVLKEPAQLSSRNRSDDQQRFFSKCRCVTKNARVQSFSSPSSSSFHAKGRVRVAQRENTLDQKIKPKKKKKKKEKKNNKSRLANSPRLSHRSLSHLLAALWLDAEADAGLLCSHTCQTTAAADEESECQSEGASSQRAHQRPRPHAARA